MIRLGDLIRSRERSGAGDYRIIQAADNLAAKLVFPNLFENTNFYIHKPPLVGLTDFRIFPQEGELFGEYECMLLGKLRSPVNSSVVVSGPIGSGKSTTLRYLINRILVSSCDGCNSYLSCNGHHLTAQIDFLQISVTGKEHEPKGSSSEAFNKILDEICMELNARLRKFITPVEEYIEFWNELINKYDSGADGLISPIARRIIDRKHDVFSQLQDNDHTEKELRDREILLRELRKEDIAWYFKYIVMLWRYIHNKRHAPQRECSLVVFDNLDSLAPSLQRLLIDFVIKTAHLEGPTFVLPMRPETRMRHGLADGLMDIVNHTGIKPMDVVMDRLERFVGNPGAYDDPKLGLTPDQFRLLTEHVNRTFVNLKSSPDNPLVHFINRAAGHNIRLGLVLAQGIFLVDIADLKNPELSLHHIVRACIRLGNPQFHGDFRSPVENMFQVLGIGDDRALLIKCRIMKYISDQNGSCRLNKLRNIFLLYGYDEHLIKQAVNELARAECQLLRSDGLDYYRETWGDENETLYLTVKGEGYINDLICDTNYIQEVMLDVSVKKEEWSKDIAFDYLTDKLELMCSFLRHLHKVDASEAKEFVGKLGIQRYHDLFGTRLLSLNIIQGIYRSTGKIITSQMYRHQGQRDIYEELLSKYTSLLNEVEFCNKQILGIQPQTIERFQI